MYTFTNLFTCRYIDKKYDPANAPVADKPVAAAEPKNDGQEQAKQQQESAVNKGLNGL
jgi:hypothetical protein